MEDLRWGRVILVIGALFVLSTFFRCGGDHYGNRRISGYGYGGGSGLGMGAGFLGGYFMGRSGSRGNERGLNSRRSRGAIAPTRSNRRSSFGGRGFRGGGFRFGK